MWNKAHLLSLIEPGESPWQTEIHATQRMNALPNLRVLGTRQAPVRHLIAINKGELDLYGAWQFPKAMLSDADRTRLIYAHPQLLERTKPQ